MPSFFECDFMYNLLWSEQEPNLASCIFEYTIHTLACKYIVLKNPHKLDNFYWTTHDMKVKTRTLFVRFHSWISIIHYLYCRLHVDLAYSKCYSGVCILRLCSTWISLLVLLILPLRFQTVWNCGVLILTDVNPITRFSIYFRYQKIWQAVNQHYINTLWFQTGFGIFK